MPEKLTRLSAVELARLVRTKKASPVEVVEAHLAAIQRINPAVNAFCTVAAEKALAWARLLGGDGAKGVDRGVDSLDRREMRLDHFDRARLFRADEPRELDGGESGEFLGH